MSGAALYDEDILLWSEQQAEAIRRLGRTRRDLPNELDIENVAEEIESVGRSELASVESHIQNILVHLIKLAIDPDSEAADHWRDEVFSFHSDMRRRYAPSMRQHIDMNELWRLARKHAGLTFRSHERFGALPTHAPFELDDILDSDMDSLMLATRLTASR
jgi:hypothetical protein